jgi:hypothetical protein
MVMSIFFQNSSCFNSNIRGPKYTMIIVQTTWTLEIHDVPISKTVFNIYNYHEEFVCHYDYLSFLVPNVDCHLDVTPYFFGPQVPPPTV